MSHIPDKLHEKRMQLQLDSIESPSNLPTTGRLNFPDSDKKSGFGFTEKLRENKLKLMFDCESPNLCGKIKPALSPMTDLAFNLNDTSLCSPGPVSSQEIKKKLALDMESSPSPSSSVSSDSGTPLAHITNKPKGRSGRGLTRRNTEPIKYSVCNKENIPLPFKVSIVSPMKSSPMKSSPMKQVDSPLSLKDRKSSNRVIQSPDPKSFSTKVHPQKRTYFKVLEDDDNSRDSGYSSQPAEDVRVRKKSRQEPAALPPINEMNDMRDLFKDIDPSKETDGFAPLSASPSGKSSKSSNFDGFDPDTLDILEEDEEDTGTSNNRFTALLEKNILTTKSDDDFLRKTDPSRSSPGKKPFRRALTLNPVPGCVYQDSQSPISRSSSFKRPELPAPSHSNFCLGGRKKRLSNTGGVMVERSVSLQYPGNHPARPVLQRSQSETGISKIAAEFIHNHDDVLPDSYGTYCLPSEKGKSRNHPNLRSITCHTLADLIAGKYEDSVNSYRIIDVRYAFEYEGGHIRGAENWQHGEDEEFLSALLPEEPLAEAPCPGLEKKEKRNILIFHCEFSSQRAPDFYNKLRDRDRSMHDNVYPALHYPECYLLHLGYKEFWNTYPELCTGKYTEMVDPRYGNQLRKCRSKSKSWSGGTVSRTGALSRKFH